jgi:ABC-type branched-subunit amino acid transport system substrate-binding protein
MILLVLVLISILQFSGLRGQVKPANYGNIPDELVAYDKYMKAYKYHFLEPTQFYGAGREKLPPSDLKEVRLGFLGPLEGSVILPLGKQMLQGSMLAIEEANNP